ncbi:MAG: formyltransferase family protein [Eubacteriales bacterium]|nr:formyltransferase family protein [Eubacteriales bacterium]
MKESCDQAVILGTGSLALNCALTLKRNGYPFRLFDMNDTPSKTLGRQAAYYHLDYVSGSKAQMFEALLKIPGNVLLISAINPCIVPKRVLRKEGLRAVNCHQALLPRHPGRNAEMWAVYEGDRETGITWHEMTPEVDGGAILVQKSFALTEKDTAYSVFKKQSALAYEAFQEILPGLMAGTLTGTAQKADDRESIHYSWEMPENGILKTDWSGRKISAFLRSVDYAGLSVLAHRPVVWWEGTLWSWKKYWITAAKTDADFIAMEREKLVMQKGEYYIELSLLSRQYLST